MEDLLAELTNPDDGWAPEHWVCEPCIFHLIEAGFIQPFRVDVEQRRYFEFTVNLINVLNHSIIIIV